MNIYDCTKSREKLTNCSFVIFSISSLNSRTREGWTPLMAAVANGEHIYLSGQYFVCFGKIQLSLNLSRKRGCGACDAGGARDRPQRQGQQRADYRWGCQGGWKPGGWKAVGGKVWIVTRVKRSWWKKWNFRKQHPAPPLPGASNVAKKAQGLKNGKEKTLNNFGIIPCEKIKLSTKYWWRKKCYSVMMFNAMYMLWFSFKAFKATLKSYQNFSKIMLFCKLQNQN